MKSKLFLLILMVFSYQGYFSKTFAEDGPSFTMEQYGDGAGNGGDSCELKIIEIRDMITSWILQGGSKNLWMPRKSTMTVEKYNKQMLWAMEQANIDCTDKILKVGKSQKICKNFINSENKHQIVCNRKSFLETSQSHQFKLVHHEYAGVAGIEVNKGRRSNYVFSHQVTDHFENDAKKYLAIRGTVESIPSNITDDAIFKIIRSQSLENVKKMLYKWAEVAPSGLLTVIDEGKDSILLTTKVSDKNDTTKYWQKLFISLRFSVNYSRTGYKDGVKVSLLKGSSLLFNKPVEEAKGLCLIEKDLCPQFNVELKTYGASLNYIRIDLEASDTSDPDDDSYGIKLYFQAMEKKPLWLIMVWDDEEDSGPFFPFSYSSND